ncbi:MULTISPECIES: hypothetical protein [Bacillus]|uniref:hypothetical protein n=1 Tax=Bacillus TaxID=1386 RepID=UPI002540CFD3|nr:hypothetical protein [Bacillus altitudinis]
MKENTWIEGWFEKCEELEIKPREWDFKQSYIKEPVIPASPIKLMLKYKINKLNEIDCDKKTVQRLIKRLKQRVI